MAYGVKIAKDSGHSPLPDVILSRWSTALLALVVLAAFLDISIPLYVLIKDGPISISRNNGQDIWTHTFHALPIFERLVLWSIVCLPNLFWAYGLLQFGKLAQYYRTGLVFAERNAVCFIRLGVALCLVGVAQTIRYPAANLFLYWRGITPWLGDQPLLMMVRPDYLMAGVFFLILGKVMQRAKELEENNRLII